MAGEKKSKTNVAARAEAKSAAQLCKFCGNKIEVVMTLTENDLDACIGMRGKDSDVLWNRLPGKWLLTFVAEWIAGQAMTMRHR